ncbi:porin family protein [Flavobacterium celericrescens]|uniref:Porin family protein n=1 Tax=Flavobacterium celericrescens TaxID=2709780 RepID=A0ABX0IDC1_9FLAO|nr:porin family protein [Flavobacterium celericrescens]NHM04607.1 porin family protein [Flavobacterium celericrescens]
MKKILLSAIALLAFGFAEAQNREKGAIELIPQIGYSSANYYGEEDFDSNTISGVTFGVGADYFFNDRWSLRSGLHYQKMGAKGTGGYEEKLNYLTLPVNANWHFGSTRKWNLNFGPSFSMLMSAENNFGDIKDEANSFQLGLAYGIGYKIEVNEKFSILIDMQGITGLTEVPKESDFTLKNAYSSINVGGVFKL